MIPKTRSHKHPFYISHYLVNLSKCIKIEYVDYFVVIQVIMTL